MDQTLDARATDAVVVHTMASDSTAAGGDLGREILERFDGQHPDAVILFASPVYQHATLLRALGETCSPRVLTGCSSAGEFTGAGVLASSAVALALRSEKLRFDVHVARGIKVGPHRAAQALASSFRHEDDAARPYRAALLLMDALAGYGEEVLATFTTATAGRYQVFGGGAADDAAFVRTFVYAGDEALSDAVVALEIQSPEPIGIGVSHGWTPASEVITVTAASGLKVSTLGGRPASAVFASYAQARGQSFDPVSPLPFFLHNVLGIADDKGYRLRVPLSVEADGSVMFAAEVPVGSKVRIMRTSVTAAADAARIATQRALAGLEGAKPGVTLFFDCAATRLRLGHAFGSSVQEIVGATGSPMCVGCNTYGQFARLPGQFSGFHNCTAVVCTLPA